MSYVDQNTPEIVVRSLFLKYDKDGSGCLCREELRDMFTEDFGLNKEQTEAYIHLLDKDGSGDVSFEEYRAWITSGEGFRNVDDSSRFFMMKEAVELFKTYDTDGSMALERHEAENLFRDIGVKEKDLSRALQALDSDGNGKISFPEFLDWLKWLPMD